MSQKIQVIVSIDYSEQGYSAILSEVILGIVSDKCMAILKEKINLILKGPREYEIVYKYSIRALLVYYQGVIPSLAEVSEIRKENLYSFADRGLRPSTEESARIIAAFHKLGGELSSLQVDLS